MKHDFLYVIWKNPKSRKNYTVGKLTKSDGYLFEYSNEYKAYLLALGYSEASTNVFVKDDIEIEIVNNEDNCEFLHIYKTA